MEDVKEVDLGVKGIERVDRVLLSACPCLCSPWTAVPEHWLMPVQPAITASA
jgi:hypothetical protein